MKTPLLFVAGLCAVTLPAVGCGSKNTEPIIVRANGSGSSPVDSVITDVPIDSDKEKHNKPRYFDNVVVLLVAVSEYESSAIESLAFPITDALALKECFEIRYGYRVETLFNKEATKESVESKVRELGKNLGANDAFIVHFGGHGMAAKRELLEGGYKGYYVPFDAAVSSLNEPGGDSWQDSVIEMGGFTQLLEDLPARHVLLLADCCNSGFAAHTTIRGKVRRDLSYSVLNPSCSVVTATTSDRTVSGGKFSPALMAALNTREAKSLCEVVVEVKKAVADAGLRPQHAQFRRDGGDFVFLPLAVAEDDIKVQMDWKDKQLQEARSKLTTLKEALFAMNAADYRTDKNPLEQHENWKELFETFDDKASVQWPRDELAQFALYQCWKNGLGVTEPSPSKAFAAATLAYQSGSATGKLLVGDALYRGLHVSQNKTAGLGLIKEAAEADSPIAKFVLGDILLKRGRAENVKRGLELLEEAAKEGVINADIALAQAYSGVFSNYKAGKIPTNIGRSIKSIQKVMDDDNRPAEGSYQAFLMQETFREQFRNVIPKERLALLLDASHKGMSDAHVDLAKVYLFRAEYYGVHADKGAARDLLVAAAKADNRVAHDMLSVYYSQGGLVGLDYELAEKHGIKAANLGSGTASRRLGIWYYDSKVVERDYAKAFEFFRKAASQGDAEGCRCLASMFDRGEGNAASLARTEQLAEATHWLMKACELGDAKALDYFVSDVTNKFSHTRWRGASHDLWKTHADSALTMIRRAAYRARYISGRKRRTLPSEGAPKNWSQLQPENSETAYIGGFAIGENSKASFYAAESFVSSHSATLDAWFRRYSGDEKTKTIKRIEGGLVGTVSGTFHEPAWLDDKEYSQGGYTTVALALDGGLVCDLTGPSDEVEAARDAFINYAKSL